MGSIRLGLIGCGGIAGAHAGAVASLKQGLAKANPQAPVVQDVSVTAVVDPVAEARPPLAEKTGAQAFATLEDLLAARAAGTVAVDAAVLCVPPSCRIPLVEAALNAGLAVLAEKPLAHTVREAAALVALAEGHPDQLTAVAYCHRFTPALVEMKRLLHAGKVGAPVRFENHFACWHPTLQTKWMSDPSISGGGSLVDTGCHSLDLLGFLVDGLDRVNVRAVSLNHQWEGRGDTNATMLVDATLDRDRFAGVIHSGWCEADRFTVSITGTRGTLAYDFLDQPEVLRFTPSHPDAGQPEAITVENHDVRFVRQLAAFAHAFVEGGRAGLHEAHGLASFGEGAAVARLVQDAYAAAEAAPSKPAPAPAPKPVVAADVPAPKLQRGRRPGKPANA
ncbi:MAG: Gfo/Idh/MocA family oxidoreductase [Planctomycetota bacterium]